MAERSATLEHTLAKLLDEKKYQTLRDILITMNASDIAATFEEMEQASLPRLFRLLPKELAAETFVEMDAEAQELLILGFSDNELKEVVDELYVDDAVDLVEEMPANVVKRILRQADPEMRKMINDMLRYPDDSAGSIMTTEYVSLRPEMTVEEAFKRIRRTGIDKETIYTCYITENDRTLVGFISIRSLLLADEEAILKDIMEQNVISVNTLEDQETVAQMFSKYSFIALPVVDKENRLVGIVTIDDAMDVLQEEATEDIQKMAAISPSDKPYLKSGVFELFKSRVFWLMFLMLSATFTGIILTSFENALLAQAALVIFIPMLMGTGGNSGSQASVTIIRSLSLGDVVFSDLLKIIWKEARVSLLCGTALAAVGFVKIMLVDRLIMGNPEVTVYVALVVSLTLIATVFLAKLIGCALPLVAQKVGLDPAVMASPFLTTIVDALSLLSYFQIAKWVLHI